MKIKKVPSGMTLVQSLLILFVVVVGGGLLIFWFATRDAHFDQAEIIKRENEEKRRQDVTDPFVELALKTGMPVQFKDNIYYFSDTPQASGRERMDFFLKTNVNLEFAAAFIPEECTTNIFGGLPHLAIKEHMLRGGCFAKFKERVKDRK